MGFRSARVKAGKKVVDVMKHMGVSDAAVYQWESGETMPTAKKLQKLADFYSCSVDELLSSETEENRIDNQSYPVRRT